MLCVGPVGIAVFGGCNWRDCIFKDFCGVYRFCFNPEPEILFFHFCAFGLLLICNLDATKLGFRDTLDSHEIEVLV